MNARLLTRRLVLALLAVVLAGVAQPAFAGATITVLIGDGPGEGFNDPTPAVPVGGNTGTTLGEQRLIAFQHAANIWGSTIDSNVEIFIGAFFDPLNPGVLGQAGAWDIFSDFSGTSQFPGAQFPQTWYGSALADKRAGRDLDETAPDIFAAFSTNFVFYLGLDNNHGAQPDLVAVLLHEFAHGLGFQNFVNETTGSNFGDPTDPTRYPFQTDIYSHYTLDLATGKYWNEMSDAERAASAIRYGGVVWDGAKVTAAVPQVLSFGSPFLRIDSPAAIAGLYQFGTAQFGPPIGPAISGAVQLVNDGVAPTSNGCEPLAAGSLAGQIALIDRGTCGFAVKAKIAQDAGAVAVIIANNVAGPPPGMAGADPTLVIPTVSVSLADGNAIKAQLGGGVSASLGVDLAIRAGADPFGHARLYAVNPVAPGSSISHYDSIASRNLLMEPAINADLTHSVKAPEDMTFELLQDVGWFPDEDLDGVATDGDQCSASNQSPTVVIGSCDSGVPNTLFGTGCTISDLIGECERSCHTRWFFDKVRFVLCVNNVTHKLQRQRAITGRQRADILVCAIKSRFE